MKKLVAGLVGVAVLALAGVVLAETINNQMFSTAYGTAKFTGVSTSKSATLVVDNLTVTGTVTVANSAIGAAKLVGVAKNAQSSTTDLKVRYGTCTNGQTVTWGEVFTAVVYTAIEAGAASTNNYFSSVNITNGVAAVHPKAVAKRYIVIGR